jgi:uncharacterized membrane protein YuzA (DUF378 family)/RNA polymerase subunit RPABC4/transcription elongation factor Spt4
MLATIRRLFDRFFRKTRTINNEPLNKVSLIVIILIDIFILMQVFTGLHDISQWHLNPSQVYPCYAEWQDYRKSTDKDKDYRLVSGAIHNIDTPDRSSWREQYQRVEVNHLGKVFAGCLNYAKQRDRVNNTTNQGTIKTIARQQSQIGTLQQKNQTIKSQYDSTLLEKIAGQERDRSINVVGAGKAKQELEINNRKIADLDREIGKLKSELLTKPESTSFGSLLQDGGKFKEVETNYQQAEFWYPSIQLLLQTLFLLPLIAIALLVHNFAQNKGYGLVALMSWHLLAIFLIPLIIKVFEFLQIGVIFRWIFDLISALFGQLLFLISFAYILLIPLVGFGIIKFFQKFVFNPKLQASNRVQSSRCMNCARKIHAHDSHCPHCGYYQYTECPNCHNLTYKNLNYCKECGHEQAINN